MAIHILKADVVGLIVIAEQGQNRTLHGVHQILRRGFHNDVAEEVGGQRAVGGQLAAEVLQLCLALIALVQQLLNEKYTDY